MTNMLNLLYSKILDWKESKPDYRFLVETTFLSSLIAKNIRTVANYKMLYKVPESFYLDVD
ncbi:hypothetical protein ABW02_17315 [Niallia circulans]|uniref:Uncharacterized protein n=1 Tax=Niallia circulans TaxID=1397 RepID=A0A0J1IFS4_NIACI|nr:hypothetical protein ABW02_17315 [Niallia circulans]